MADSQPETDSVGDLNDDSQLTIRIPNPKVFMARQSQWKGRRGKPRCDHCRVNNLKVRTNLLRSSACIRVRILTVVKSQCDRVLPSCNHCSWVVGRECKYTPLPTPAHRGIPRCDRCRAKNLKVRCLLSDGKLWATLMVRPTSSAIDRSPFAITARKRTRTSVITPPRNDTRYRLSMVLQRIASY